MSDIVIMTTVICTLSAMIEGPDASMLLTPEEITKLQDSLTQLNSTLPQPITCPKPLRENESNSGNNEPRNTWGDSLFNSDNSFSDSDQEINRHGDSRDEEESKQDNSGSGRNGDESDGEQEDNEGDLADCDDPNRDRPGSCEDKQDYDECEVTPEKCKDD